MLKDQRQGRLRRRIVWRLPGIGADYSYARASLKYDAALAVIGSALPRINSIMRRGLTAVPTGIGPTERGTVLYPLLQDAALVLVIWNAISPHYRRALEL